MHDHACGRMAKWIGCCGGGGGSGGQIGKWATVSACSVIVVCTQKFAGKLVEMNSQEKLLVGTSSH